MKDVKALNIYQNMLVNNLQFAAGQIEMEIKLM